MSPPAGSTPSTAPISPLSEAGPYWRILVLSPGSGVQTSVPLVSALRDLGHYVFDVDVEGHALAGASSGPERPLIDQDRLEPFVEAFDPQLIVNAALPTGLTCSDALRSTGRVLLALDAMPSRFEVSDNEFDEYDLFRHVDPMDIADEAWPQTWNEMLSTLRAATPDGLPHLTPVRRDAVRDILAVSLPRAKKVIVSGYYGADNLGDDLILTAIVQALRRADPSVLVTVAAENKWAVERTHALQAYSRPDHEASAREVRTAAAVVLGGGGLWHDYSYARSGGLLSFFTGARMSVAGYGIMPLMARILGRPFHVVGMGAGPLTNEDARHSVRFLAEQATSVTVRDRQSADLLASLPLPAEQIGTGPDLVYGIDLPKVSNYGSLPSAVREAVESGHVLIGLNLRSWPAGDMEGLVTATAHALTELAGKRRVAVVSVPMQWGSDRDQAVIRRVLDRLPDHIPRLQFDHRPSLSELSALYATMTVLVSMRLHAALLAHRVGVPVVGFGYDPKVDRHFAEVGRAGFCLTLDASAARILERIEAAVEDGPLAGSSRHAVARLELAARQSLRAAAEHIAATRPPAAGHILAERASSGNTPRHSSVGPESQTAPPSAEFSGMRYSSAVIGLPNNRDRARHRATPTELRLCLDTKLPRHGMTASWTGRLSVTGSGPRGVEFDLINPWTNPRAEGMVFAELWMGGFRWRKDISQHSDPVRLRLVVEAGRPSTLSLRLVVERDGFVSAGWGAATTCGLSFVGTGPAVEFGSTRLLASSGHIDRWPDHG